MTSTSPLRYPGGKARFTEFIIEAIRHSKEDACHFIEPFCGGAGVSIALLEQSEIEAVSLNDVDPLVSSFWKVVFGKSCRNRLHLNELVNRIENARISLGEWRRLKSQKPRSIVDAAWTCLFLNRTSFNGILYKSGPLGGWSQERRKIDVRFNRERLIEKVNGLYEYRDRVLRVESLDWRTFVSSVGRYRNKYLYFDPPYYNNAEQLYGYIFDESAHAQLRNYLVGLKAPWMLSYDDSVEVRRLFKDIQGVYGLVIDQTYSTHPVGGGSYVGRELFYSNRVLPTNYMLRGMKSVGLKLVGPLSRNANQVSGPIRIPFEKYGSDSI